VNLSVPYQLLLSLLIFSNSPNQELHSSTGKICRHHTFHKIVFLNFHYMNNTFCDTKEGFEIAHAGLVVMRSVILPPPFQQPTVTFQMPSSKIYPTATNYYSFSACTLKYPAWCTMFVCHHTYTYTHTHTHTHNDKCHYTQIISRE